VSDVVVVAVAVDAADVAEDEGGVVAGVDVGEGCECG